MKSKTTLKQREKTFTGIILAFLPRYVLQFLIPSYVYYVITNKLFTNTSILLSPKYDWLLMKIFTDVLLQYFMGGNPLGCILLACADWTMDVAAVTVTTWHLHFVFRADLGGASRQAPI